MIKHPYTLISASISQLTAIRYGGIPKPDGTQVILPTSYLSTISKGAKNNG